MATKTKPASAKSTTKSAAKSKAKTGKKKILGGDSASSASQQEQTETPAIVINAQYIKDLSFENPNAPFSLMPTNSQPQIDLNFKIDHQAITPPNEEKSDAEKLTEISITINASAKIEGKDAFIAELTYAGVFTVEHMDDQQKHVLKYIEGPRMLFPFCRSIIASTTREGGFPPLMLSPIDFVALYKQQMAQQQATTN